MTGVPQDVIVMNTPGGCPCARLPPSEILLHVAEAVTWRSSSKGAAGAGALGTQGPQPPPGGEHHLAAPRTIVGMLLLAAAVTSHIFLWPYYNI